MPNHSTKIETPTRLPTRLQYAFRILELLATFPAWFTKLSWGFFTAALAEYISREITPEKIAVKEKATFELREKQCVEQLSAHLDREFAKLSKLKIATDVLQADTIAMLELSWLRMLYDRDCYWHNLMLMQLSERQYQGYKTQNNLIYYAKKTDNKSAVDKTVNIKDFLKG